MVVQKGVQHMMQPEYAYNFLQVYGIPQLIMLHMLNLESVDPSLLQPCCSPAESKVVHGVVHFVRSDKFKDVSTT